jgi:thiol-disulfide isomerase/thioredoxin
MTRISPRELMLWIGVLGMAGLFAWGSTQGHHHDDQLNQPAPALALRADDGQVVDLESLRGQTVVLNFYANWCPPCRQEIPELAAFAQEAQGRPIQVYGVLFESGPPQEAIPATRKLGVTWPVLLGNQGVADRYALHSYPTTVIINPDGVLTTRHEGVVTKDLLWDRVGR